MSADWVMISQLCGLMWSPIDAPLPRMMAMSVATVEIGPPSVNSSTLSNIPIVKMLDVPAPRDRTGGSDGCLAEGLLVTWRGDQIVVWRPRCRVGR